MHWVDLSKTPSISFFQNVQMQLNVVKSMSISRVVFKKKKRLF